MYDIETTQFLEGKTDVPIDIIGHSSFSLKYSSKKDLDSEEFSFNIEDIPSSWDALEVQQSVSRNPEEEIRNLLSVA